MQLAEGGTRFVVFAGQNAQTVQGLPRPLRLTGLDPAARYRISLRNGVDKPPLSRGPNALKDGPLTLTGQALMAQGFLLPVAWPATMWVVEGERL
ncbi:GH36 C-terminal domain-containing protein [Pseudotabrizicola formosa]|uniref:GH36 C-terminal domain-containing protein n=1 Tax=Pseudotabrizicola formosa TaxID=2030009 RepID=UPI001FF07300|nr:GH36 C-terminal domain-containing protein [Pseudotabrizicola formosa]